VCSITVTCKFGDSRELIRDLDNESIDCVVTSPPYWGMRRYGDYSNQFGREPTPTEYINNLNSLFSGIHGKLKPEGNCFVNIDDSYSKSGADVPAKCLCMIPERFALMMIQNGWILRNKIIWYRKNHKPESVKDRLTHTYEYIYHFVKQKKYYYGLDDIRAPYETTPSKTTSTYTGKFKGHDEAETFGSPRARTQRKNGSKQYQNNPLGKNPGDMWLINTTPYPQAHFAVYPEKLVQRMILAGSPPGGVVLDPFGGSGTTAMACRDLGRKCILFELNNEYEKMINERLQVGS